MGMNLVHLINLLDQFLLLLLNHYTLKNRTLIWSFDRLPKVFFENHLSAHMLELLITITMLMTQLCLLQQCQLLKCCKHVQHKESYYCQLLEKLILKIQILLSLILKVIYLDSYINSHSKFHFFSKPNKCFTQLLTKEIVCVSCLLPVGNIWVFQLPINHLPDWNPEMEEVYPYGILNDLPIGLEGKKITIKVEVVDDQLNYNLFLIRSWTYAMTDVVSSLFPMIHFTH